MLGQGRATGLDGAPCRATLESKLEAGRLTVIGHCQNAGNEPLTLQYELSANKRGQAGSSRNSQSGRFTVAPQQTANLSQTTMSVAATDFYQINLRVLDLQGRVVAEDSLVHRP
ncbi:curli-like amyloid fiber formation chaperone CsgH [Hymenobacter metallicola]|uniref:curli-like amyloid fiber formation chaperone CsgH n=1 Tax=Hymenobacter metallicola TaxID=2563114 RepID=UPI0021D0D385|nr:curli-like amyloid fiber formation chaperone CsgH [Hymenobacter metallicola]